MSINQGPGFVLYHNPRCSKSRDTLEMLVQHGVHPRIVEYLNSPPDATELRSLLVKLGLRPRDILRDGEAEYAKLKLDNPQLSDDDLIAAIVKHPILLQRPIVVHGERAVVGRPPERVAELL